jgi:predicted phage gp36 major capsid-like protein
LIDSIDDFFFRIDEVERRSDFDEEARREIDDDESDDDDDDMKNAEIDRDDDSMNDLSEVDRRDFFSRKSFIDESHLMN